MSRTYMAMLILAVVLTAAATIWMAWLAASIMPVWAAAMGPILLALTLVAHLKTRR